MPSCSSCGEENPRRARFCLGCGAPITAEQVREVRKTVTIVFSDVVGSTGLGERLDPETLRRVITRYYELANTVLARHGGRVQKFVGDAVMAIFGVPVVHEDDALRAVRAALDLHAGVAEGNARLQREFGVQLDLRTGINTGEVLIGEGFNGQDITLGNVTNVAARLEQIANPGEVLLGDVTYRLVRDAVTAELLAPLALKGKGVPVEAWRLLAVKPGAAGHNRRLDAPMIGRDRELALLLQAFDRTVADGASHLVTLLGMAGAGKSRMLGELMRRASGRATVLRGQCLDYGEGMTYRPLTEVVRQAAGIGPADEPAEVHRRIRALFPPDEPAAVADSLGAILNAAPGADLEDLHLALYRLFAVLAARRPLVVVLDDLHWAESALLDLIETLAEWLRDLPVLLCLLARPELLESRPGWGGGKINSTTLLLEPLTAAESAALVDNLLDNAPGATQARTRVVEAAGGNPLYLEELVGMLIEDGLLARVEDGWITTADLSTLDVPPTISALLAARLDGLPAGERGVLERASVVGGVFYRGAVVALTPPDERRQVTEHLLSLVRKGLVRPEPSALLGESALRFRHLPLREAAYTALSKRERADLHERCGAWLAATFAGRGAAADRPAEPADVDVPAGDRATGAGPRIDPAGAGHGGTDQVSDVAELVGYHLEQACRYRTGLGPADDATAALARQAAEQLVGAGHRAFARRDMPGAVNLLGRGVALLPPGEPIRLAALPDLAAGLVEIGEFARADQALAEAATATDDDVVAAAQRIRSVLNLLVMPGAVASSDGPVTAAPASAPGGTAGWTLLRDVSWLQGSTGPIPTGTGPAGATSPTSPAGVTGTVPIGMFAIAAVLGAAPVRDTIARYADYLRQPQPSRTLAVRVLAVSAGLTAMEGRFDEARGQLTEARSILDRLGLRVRALALTYLAGFIDLLAGTPANAEAYLRRACEDCQRMGERYLLGNLLALLAQVTYAQGRYVEAVQLAEAVEEVGPTDEPVSRVTARTARAKALVRLSYADQAVPLARDAVAAAVRTGLLNLVADAYADLAEVLEATGDKAGAAAAAGEAFDRYAHKGNIVAADRITDLQRRL